MNKRMWLCVLVLAVGTVGIFAAGNQEASTTAKPLVLRWATVVGPNTPLVDTMADVSRMVKERSKGLIDLQVYHSGQLGSQDAMGLELQQGQIDMAMIAPTWLGTFYKPVGILDAPYIYRNLDHMDKVLNGPIGRELYAASEQKSGIKVLDSWYYGTRQVTSNKLAMNQAEFSGIKMRVPNSPMFFEAANSLGAKPTPIAFGELYLALKTGSVDAQENPLPTIDGSKFYEVQKFLIITDHMVNSIIPVVNAQTWSRIPAAQQQIILDALVEGRKLNNDRTVKAENELIGKFKAAGMEVYKPDTTPFRQQANEIYKKYVGDWGQGTLEKIQAVQ